MDFERIRQFFAPAAAEHRREFYSDAGVRLPKNEVNLPAGFRPNRGIHEERSGVHNFLEYSRRFSRSSPCFVDGMAAFEGYFEDTYGLTMVAVNQTGSRSMSHRETVGYKVTVDLGVSLGNRAPGGWGEKETLFLLPTERSEAATIFRLVAHDASTCQRNFQIAHLFIQYAKAAGINYAVRQDQLVTEGARILGEIAAMKEQA